MLGEVRSGGSETTRYSESTRFTALSTGSSLLRREWSTAWVKPSQMKLGSRAAESGVGTT
jgi:hypothetical protein